MRLFALALLLANGLYFAWSQGLLQPYGLAPAQQNEPQRLQQQIKPEALQRLTPEQFKQVEAEARKEQAPRHCLRAGPLDAPQAAAVRQSLQQSLPADSWVLDEVAVAARWIVYMGKYASAEVLAKKRAEVLAMNLKPETLGNPSLEPGFSLGGFASKGEADAALAKLAGRGLHTAHVVQEREARVEQWLKLPALNAEQESALAGLRSALGSSALRKCE